uniref:F-box-like family protein n=1 Tax=Pithovirus LCPAC403 TaxID=2506596 RepID=A0A481ZCX2_9VIRU|nr:MAG: F-box-like family protein [Pithovirus LCPAC403]
MDQPDLLQCILSYLRVNQIAQLSAVNLAFYLVCKRESLWKNKLWSDYGMIGKSKIQTWKKRVKNTFLVSEEFWKSLDEEMSYHITHGPFCCETSKIRQDHGITEAKIIVSGFETKLIDYALYEREEFYITELIFKSFFDTHLHTGSLDYDDYYLNFLFLFEKLAKGNVSLISSRGKLSPLVNLSTGGKLSLRWILSLNHIEEVKFIDYLDISEEEYMVKWSDLNTDMCISIKSLALVYKNHRDLFVDDTTDDQRDIVIMLNKWRM